MPLRNRAIVLAGGSGGLGAASAQLLADHGADLVIGYHRDRTRAEELAPLGRIVQADIDAGLYRLAARGGNAGGRSPPEQAFHDPERGFCRPEIER